MRRLAAGLESGCCRAVSKVESRTKAMKTTIKSIMGGLLGVAVLVGLMLAAGPARADSQGLPSTISAPTNLPSTVALATAVTQTSVVNLRQIRGIGIVWKFCVAASTNDTTSPCTIWFYPTVDGTNYATKTPFTLTGVANGTSAPSGDRPTTSIL